MTNSEIRAMLQRVDARELRLDSGISPYTVQRALGISREQLSRWERGLRQPSGPGGAKWIRFTMGLARHAEVSAEIAAAREAA